MFARLFHGILSAFVVLAPATASQAAGSTPPSLASPWTARGNEPNWSLRVEGGTMTFQPMGAAAVAAALPAPVRHRGSLVYRAAGEDLSVSVRPKVCRDTMTGMPSPLTVSVRHGGKVFAGCGGSPSELLAGDWSVVSIGGKAVPKDVKVSMAFDVGAGRVAGASGCNRYFGGFMLTGEGLSFAKDMAGSMMACPDPAMRTEDAFKAALRTVGRFDIGKDGELQLLAQDGVVVRAKRGGK